MLDHDALTTAIVPTTTAIMPVLVVAQMRERRQLMQELVRDALVREVDFGVIPGTSKPTLFKSGAEKLCTFFGLSVRLTCEDAQEDWTGEAHSGEAFFSYRYRAAISRGDMMVAEAEGSCTSWESRYRYRDSKRGCPQCGQPAIIKGKEEYGGGWVCFKKQGGCGAKYRDGDAAIEGQTIGRMPNPDVIDQVNTVQKMAQKRAMIAATLIAVNASDFFTQDLEDMPPSRTATTVDHTTGEVIEGQVTEVSAPATKAAAPAGGPTHTNSADLWERDDPSVDGPAASQVSDVLLAINNCQSETELQGIGRQIKAMSPAQQKLLRGPYGDALVALRSALREESVPA